MLIVLPNELDILRDMQPLDRDVFCYLAERVDYDTGVIGVSRKASYGGIAYDLTERQTERRRADRVRTVTSKQAENSIGRLVQAGLLERQSRSGYNQRLTLVRVFWRDALPRDKSAQNPVGSLLGVVAGVLKRSNGAASSGLSPTDAVQPVGTTSLTQHQQQQASYPQASYPQAHVLDAEDKSEKRLTMSLSWEATQAEFDAVLERAGFKSEQAKPEWVAEFVAYWYAEGQRQYTQREWTIRLALRVVDYLLNPGEFGRLRGTEARLLPSQGKTPAIPEWARIPRYDEDLTPWAIRNGYGQAAVGMTFNQYRAALRDKVARRVQQQP